MAISVSTIICDMPNTNRMRELETIRFLRSNCDKPSRAPGAHPETTGRRALENIDSKKTGGVAREQAVLRMLVLRQFKRDRPHRETHAGPNLHRQPVGVIRQPYK